MKRIVPLLFAAGLLCAQTPTNYWILASGSGNWHQPANWSLGTVPDTNTVAVITNLPNTTLTLLCQDAPATALLVVAGGVVTGARLNFECYTNLVTTWTYNGWNNNSDFGLNLRGNVTFHLRPGALLDSPMKIVGITPNTWILDEGSRVKWCYAAGNKSWDVNGGLAANGALLEAPWGGPVSSLTLPSGFTNCTFRNISAISAGANASFSNCTADVTGLSLAGARVELYDTAMILRKTTDASLIGTPTGGNTAASLNLYGSSTFVTPNFLQICYRPDGYVNVLGANSHFISTNRVTVGAINTGGNTYIIGKNGYVAVSNGLFEVTNLWRTASLELGHITEGTLVCAGGRSIVDNLVLSTPPSNNVGRLLVNGGALSVRQSFTATNRANSVITLAKGALLLANARVSLGAPLAVGNGTDTASLGILSGTHVFADGIAVKSAAYLRPAAAATLTGDIALETGAGLAVDFADTLPLVVNGTVAIAGTPALLLASRDGSAPKSGVLLQAATLTASFSKSAMLGATRYRIYTQDNTIRFAQIPARTQIFLY